MVTMGWVPQVAILAHGAVGAFLTHCGRSSLIEGLLYGHPLIMLPIATDQGPNARFMERRKIGLQVPRDGNDGSFDRHGIASTVRVVMVEEDARKAFVENALKMQEVVADKELHERYIDDFVEKLRSYNKSKSRQLTCSCRQINAAPINVAARSEETTVGSTMDAAAAGSSSPSSPSRPLRLVLCPWLAFGHMLPYLELAERLASRGHHVSFVSTPRNLARLPPLRRHAGGGVVDLVALPLPRVDGLPDGAESTNDVPSDRREPLWEAFDGLAVPFAEFLAVACAGDGPNNERPDWVIADTLSHWGPAAAREHGIPSVMILNASMVAALGCGTRDHGELAATSVFEQPAALGCGRGPAPAGMLRYEWEGLAPMFVASGTSGMSVARRSTLTFEQSVIIATRTCQEWEPEAFLLAARLLGKPLVPLGLCPPSTDGGRGPGMHRDDATVRWLDAQPAKSVVYVALGSEVPLSVEMVHELALGLELSEVRFLWALRKPGGIVNDDNVLPPGFEERTHGGGHGLVTMGWVPQVTILSHSAVGAFLTHCGRSSLMEGLLYGHPLIMLPIATDQGPNARHMEGRKVGLQVPRNENDGSFDRHGIASTVRAVMVKEDARRVFVANALKMQEVVADTELHERYIDEFVLKLRSYSTIDNSSSNVTPHIDP
ncbi:hypothetical protein HU200_007954 [Digitaria exilis]|uniref:UDP-glycosyltransferases domain-containing protein n=1 Tax=Digitaria exilis TaxID=1010633 RepID=A0A835FPQ6_9POAL|nr:hypothetical protein HU200_007954 [Digitaria exilis]